MGNNASQEQIDEAVLKLRIGFVVFCTVVTTIAAYIFCGSDAAVRSLVFTPLLFGCMMYLTRYIVPESGTTLDNIIINFMILTTITTSAVWLLVCGKKAAFRAAFVPVVLATSLLFIALSINALDQRDKPVFYNASTVVDNSTHRSMLYSLL